MYNYLAEFFGTAVLVYVILASGQPLFIGLCYAVLILLTSSISGGHINPAVTITMVQAGKLPQSEMLPYIASQIAGALAALQINQRM